LLPATSSAPDDVDVVSARLARVVRELGVGARLPGERQLANQLGVSRTALRDRLQVLHALGVLRRASGSGTYVQALDSAAFARGLDFSISAVDLDLDELTSVRVALERQAGVEAARAAEPVLIAHMKSELNRMRSATTDGALGEADFRFHLALLSASHNNALRFFADALAGVLQEQLAHRRAEMRRLLAATGDQRLMHDLHDAIYQAVLSGDAHAASHAVDAHFAAFDELVGKPSGATLAAPGDTAGSAAVRPTVSVQRQAAPRSPTARPTGRPHRTHKEKP
jgi:GntR family transcriptional repressor for pyruvate dehydrogenase complex